MNETKVRQEIEKVIAEVKPGRQYPASKAQLNELEALGLLNLMPANPRIRKIGYADAAAVLTAANDAGQTSAVMNREGEGEEIHTTTSALYNALNETEDSDVEYYGGIMGFVEADETEDDYPAEAPEDVEDEIAEKMHDLQASIIDELSSVMTAGEIVECYGLDESTVRQTIRRGDIPARKSGGTWLVLRSVAEARWGNRAK